MTDLADLNNRFKYHRPDERAQNDHQAARAHFLAFACAIDSLLPESREKSLFLTNLEQAGFWAHAAIARHDDQGQRR